MAFAALDGNLQDPSDARASRARSTGSGLTWLQTQHLSAIASVDHERWSQLMEPEREKWHARARDEGRSRPQRRYAARRLEALSLPYTSRAKTCGDRGCAVKCGCDGEGFRPYTCRKHVVCARCKADRLVVQRIRVREGIERAWRMETRGGHRRNVVMLTLTCSHDGGVESQRRRLADGWRAFYKRLHREGWGAFPYVAVYEVTRGEDHTGHVHIHVVAIMPFRPWGPKIDADRNLHDWWREACPTSSHLNVRVSQNARGAAWYVTKYIAKGVQSVLFTPQLRADIAAAFYGRKWIFSSTKFFAPWDGICARCGCELHRVRRSVFCGAAPFGPETSDDATGPPQEALAFPRAASLHAG